MAAFAEESGDVYAILRECIPGSVRCPVVQVGADGIVVVGGGRVGGIEKFWCRLSAGQNGFR